MKYEVCKKCEKLDVGLSDTPSFWWCCECGEYCEDVENCPMTSKRYKVHVSVVMEADAYVYAENEEEAYDKVDSGVYPIDYANETCGFETEFDIEDVTCDCNYMEIHDVKEAEK